MQRASGILMHPGSLPSAHGIGDLGPEARSFVDALADASQRYWQILPLNPPDPVNGWSPYFSRSAFAGNPLLVSLQDLENDGLLSSREVSSCPVDTGPRVDYEAVVSKKMPLVLTAARRLCAHDDEFFVQFCRQESAWLDEYALFMALCRTQPAAAAWVEWPAALRDRDEGALLQARELLADEIREQQAVQYLFFRQWAALRNYCAGRGILIIGDLPIYVSLGSSDVWVHPGLFKLDESKKPLAVSGVPPDYFSATGQLWNNPVYNWARLRECGFDWWIQRMQATFNRHDIVRIDHFRGLVQFWEVPAGELTAINGRWSDVPVDDFLQTLQRSVRPMNVIAEDLGIITDDVRAVMQRYGFPGMKVLLFAFDSDDPAHPYLPSNHESNAVVYTGTHDNLTVRGWFDTVADDAAKSRLQRLLGHSVDSAAVAWEMVSLAQHSPADTAIIPLQDLLGLGCDARMNDPATMEGNWRWRCTPAQMAAVPWAALKQMTATCERSV